MPERGDIKIISNTIIAERVSGKLILTGPGFGNEQPFHFGMVFSKMKSRVLI
jgi:hypothetical protein